MGRRIVQERDFVYIRSTKIGLFMPNTVLNFLWVYNNESINLLGEFSCLLR